MVLPFLALAAEDLFVTDTYRQNNLEKIKSAGRLYYQRNRSKILSKQRSYYASNRMQILARVRRRRARDLDRLRAYNNQWYHANRDKIAKRAKQRRAMNLDKYRYQARISGLRTRAALSDGYVKKRLVHLSLLTPHQIPASLVQAKRAQLKLHRLIRKME